MKGIKVVSFDFDGVFVIDSDAVFKREAYERIFAGHQGKYEVPLQEANKLFGSGKPGGRVGILRHVFQKLGEPESTIDNRVEEASREFDSYVQGKIAESGLAAGAYDALEDLSRRGIAIYLNSGTTTLALSRSAKNLGIAHFFKIMLGSTKEPVGGSKAENLRLILEREGVDSGEMLFVGDSDSDAEAARECGCRFLGMVNRWNAWKDAEKPFPVVTDLREVVKHI